VSATVTQSPLGIDRSISVPGLPPVTSAAPFANPTALWLFAFALTTFLCAAVTNDTFGRIVLPVRPLEIG